ncbi:unnamed protein product [Bursaphelenchus xylophilus]|nr:unnamed protein product [Bursaphelenchus xylophilus]CAG9131721.1 unnamed protein product [Bursaphelenchus xylophilus]
MEVTEIPPTNCQQIVDEIDNDLRFIATSNILKLYLAGGLLGVEFKLFLVKNEEFRHYLVYELALGTKLSIRHECNTKDQNFVKTSTFALLSHLQATFEKFDGFTSVCTRDDIREAADEYFNSINSHPFFATDLPNWVFYFDDNQVEKLMKTSLELPEGYEFSKLRPEDAVEVVNDTLYTTKSDEKFIE